MKNLQKILEEQFERYKKIQVQDVYKLLYQASFGNEHLIDDKAKEELYKEYNKAKPTRQEDLSEIISPNFPICRINIRPYKMFVNDKELLFKWLYESSKTKTGSIEDFKKLWADFKEINKEKKYFPDADVEAFEEHHLKKEELPVIHHSKQYKKANKPHYRVINYSLILEFHRKGRM